MPRCSARTRSELKSVGDERLSLSSVGIPPDGIGPVGIGLGGLVLELQSSLLLPFGFLGVAPSRELCFPGSLGRSVRFFSMLRSLFALLLELLRLATGRPVDRRSDYYDNDDNKYDHPCIHWDLTFSIDLLYPTGRS